MIFFLCELCVPIGGTMNPNGEVNNAALPPPFIPQIPLGMVANTVDAFSGKENPKLYFDKLEQRAVLDNWTEDTTLKLFK